MLDCPFGQNTELSIRTMYIKIYVCTVQLGGHSAPPFVSHPAFTCTSIEGMFTLHV